MASTRFGARTGSIGGRGNAKGARVVGGPGPSQVRNRGARQGRHPGLRRGTRRVGG